MWTWDQSAGELRRDGKLMSRGYSGAGRGINNPAMQAMRMVGPIPRGHWLIVGPPYSSPALGPYVLRVYVKDEPVPDDNVEALGRGAFRIHGDNARGDRSASHGCIILPRQAREAIWRSGDRDLEVVA